MARTGILLAVIASGFLGCDHPSDRVVIYCAQDREFAESILDAFSKETGIRVEKKYDTEATKSVSLYTELVEEKAKPRCDVHWNNEILSTIRLQRMGILAAYRSHSSAPYPDYSRSSDGTWQAFASRARVILVNTNLVPSQDRPKNLNDLTDPKWKNRVAIAKPQFGTTATHAACLFEVWGDAKAKDFFLGLKANGVQIVSGNKQVAEGVGTGAYALGITDTDDAFVELEARSPVAIVFPDRDSREARCGTLFIPNTLAVIKGSPNQAGAKRLVDYLLGRKVEKLLAEGPSHQLPLNPQVDAKLPDSLETPRTVRAMQVDFERAADLWESVQKFLREEFARP